MILWNCAAQYAPTAFAGHRARGARRAGAHLGHLPRLLPCPRAHPALLLEHVRASGGVGRARRVACARPVGRLCACAPAHPQRNARPKTRRQRSIYGCARTPDAAQDARPSGGLAHAPAVGRASFAASAGASAQVCAPARVLSRATRLLVGPRACQAVLVRLSHAGRAADRELKREP